MALAKLDEDPTRLAEMADMLLAIQQGHSTSIGPLFFTQYELL